MLRIITEVRLKVGFGDLGMRIGIHTGDLFGGIVGTDIVRFDIYGENVLVANHMESLGERMRINISESTYNLLRNFKDLEFIANKTASLFDKEIPMYFVSKKEG